MPKLLESYGINEFNVWCLSYPYGFHYKIWKCEVVPKREVDKLKNQHSFNILKINFSLCGYNFVIFRTYE